MSPPKRRYGFIILALFFIALVQRAPAQATLTVDVDQPGHPISPALWGIFFEDINLSADGGIYPELVRNRSFEDSNNPEYWTVAGAEGGRNSIAIDSSKPLNPYNRHCLRIVVDGSIAIENEGYWGMNIVQGGAYLFKMAARAPNHFSPPLTVRLLGAGGELARGEVRGLTGDWHYHTLALTARAGDPGARLQISVAGKGELFLDMVSLMPKETWKGHGLRVDLAESLDGLRPSFVRFPGGCWVEGDDFAHMNHWKRTIGNIDSREPLWNIWGYNATQGLGYYEYLQMCEDLHAAPLFCINVGMSHHDTIPISRMGEWVQDALDAAEYANGPANTLWGGLRAKAGHPGSFHLKYMEIGNENGGPDYIERWPLLANALRQNYPEIQLIADTDLRGGPYPKNPPPDVVDEHYYESPESFMNRANQYDHYSRRGPKIFVGEYAVTKNCGKGNLRAAIGEAAFMTGLERNSDIVVMASYAPLLVNLNHRAWNPDLINFDSAHWYGLPSYYVQRMFSKNRGDVVLPVSVDSPMAPPVNGNTAGMIGLGTWNTEAEFKDLKVTAPDGKVLFASDFSTNSDGWKKLGDGDWTVKDGALRQNAEKEFVRAIAGRRSWTDYTLTLKARKLGGKEGFLILFHIADDEDRLWWNIGGWGNTQDAIESGGTIDPKPSQIETGPWYDIRLAVRGRRVQCYLDNKLIHDAAYEIDRPVKALYAAASHDDQTGDLILKVVNAGAAPMDTAIHLRGAKTPAQNARAIVLTSANPADENSLETPEKVSPKTQSLSVDGPDIQHTFPGNSLTILRIATSPMEKK